MEYKAVIKRKLLMIIQNKVLEDVCTELPESVENFILQKQGWAIDDKSDVKCDLNSFIKDLEKWIQNFPESTSIASNVLDETTCNIKETFKNFLLVETEYSKVAANLVCLLEIIVKQKETYSDDFKKKSMYLENSAKVLNKKLEFVKLQFFLKLYGEGNAKVGHIKLKQVLKNNLKSLNLVYNELLERNLQYDKMKGNKYFIELFKTYKKLKEIEKKSEIIGEI